MGQRDKGRGEGERGRGSFNLKQDIAPLSSTGYTAIKTRTPTRAVERKPNDTSPFCLANPRNIGVRIRRVRPRFGRGRAVRFSGNP